VRKEVLMLAKEAERCAKKGAADADWSRRVGTFYTKHETLIRATLPVSEPAAKQYCAEHAALLNVHGASALVEVEAEGTARLLGFLEVSP
jgi:hypothetical protein